MREGEVPRRAIPRRRPAATAKGKKGCKGCGKTKPCAGCGKKFTRRDSRLAVGFLAVVFDPPGGTETWHRLLLPALSTVQVVGLVATWKDGDMSGLGCPTGSGIDAARDLAANVDVLVEWGVEDLRAVLPDVEPPRVVSVHHGDINSTWARQMIERRLEISQAIACVHPDVAAELAAKGVNAVYLPNPVDVPDTAAELSGTGSRRVLWLARFSSEKRPLLAIEIARQMPGVEFRIVGSGVLFDSMCRAASGLPNVTLAPAVSTPWPELARAGCFLSTSDQEGFGYSIAEAMVVGVPVVSTPCGVAATPGLCSTVAIDAPVESWVAAIAATLNERDATQVDRARDWIVKHHSPSAIISQWERLLSEVARAA